MLAISQCCTPIRLRLPAVRERGTAAQIWVIIAIKDAKGRFWRPLRHAYAR